MTLNTFSLNHLRELAAEHHEAWIRRGIIIVAVAYAISFGFGYLSGSSQFPAAYTDVGAFVLSLVAMLLFRRGHVQPAAALTIAAVWTEAHATMLITSADQVILHPVLPVLIAGAGLLLGGRYAYGLAILTSLTVPVVRTLNARITGHVFVASDWHAMIVIALTCIGMAALIAKFLHSFGVVLRGSVASERRYADLFRNAPDGIVSVDDTGRITAVNPAAAALLEVRPDDVVGRDLVETLRPALGEDAEPTARRLSAAVTKPVVFTFPCEIPVACEVFARRLPADGPEPGMQLVIRDITRRLTAEERATQLGRILEQATGEIYLIDAASRRVLIASRGARRALGYRLEDLQSMPLTMFSPVLSDGRVAQVLGQLRADPHANITITGMHVRRDATSYPVELRVQAGVVDHTPVLIAFAADTSERVAAEQEQRHLQRQLEQAQKMEAVGRLAGGIAHDFNNLLMVIGASAEFLRESSDAMARELAGDIAKAQKRGADLTRQLLTVARREVAQPRAIDLAAVIDDLDPLLRRLAGTGLTLAYDLHGPAPILADAGQIEQILLNLVANARDATPDGGTITVGVAAGAPGGTGAGFVELRVADTGVGMDEVTARQIFEPFFTTKPRGKGTGLGLAMVHGIVTQHRGRIEVASAPGRGTTVTVFWPAGDVPGPAPVSPDADQARSACADAAGTILLVDDDEQTRTLLARQLATAGYDLRTACDATEALAHLDDPRNRFDLLLTDVLMPGISGVELAHTARRRRPDLPVLLVSGFVQDPARGGASAPPPYPLLLKPFRRDDLLEAIATLLDDGD